MTKRPLQADSTEGESTSADAIEAGAAVYSPLVLRFYDLLVLRTFVPHVWGCPLREVRQLYGEALRDRHLDVGVGTGYFLDVTPFPGAREQQLTLLDLNRNSLSASARRLARYRPTTICGSVLEPFPVGEERFDSVALNTLLHCVPGALAEKAVAFDHALAVMTPGASLFGCTILGRGIEPNWRQRFLLDRFNRRGIFHNRADDQASLERELDARFDDVEINVRGLLALFRGTKPTTAGS